MPEPSARDRQRLEALQARLDATREEKRAWTEERRTLRARASAGDRAVKRLGQVETTLSRLEDELEAERGRRSEAERSLADVRERLDALDRQKDDLVTELRRLAEEVQSLQRENGGLRDAMAQASRERAAAVAEAEKAAAARRELEQRVKTLTAEHTRSTRALQAARAQLEAQERPVVLPVEEAAALVENLLGNLRASLPGLDVRDGEMRLKLAFAAVGGTRGFVVPSGDAPERVTGPLHEVALRFERSAAIEPPPA